MAVCNDNAKNCSEAQNFEVMFIRLFKYEKRKIYFIRSEINYYS